MGYYLYFGSRSLLLFRFCFCTSEHLKDLKSFKLKTSTMASDQRPGLIHSLKVPIRLAILFYMQDKQISSGLEITTLVLKFIKLYSVFFFFLLTNLEFKQILAGKSVCSMLNMLCMLWNIKISIYKLGVGTCACILNYLRPWGRKITWDPAWASCYVKTIKHPSIWKV